MSDLDATASGFRERGVTFHRDLTQTNRGTREFYVLDDQGHVLCFAGRPLQGSGR